MRGHEEEFGNLTVGDQSLIRTAALLALKCGMQSAVVRGESPAKAYRTYEFTFANGKPIFTLSEASRIMEKAFEEIFGPNTIEYPDQFRRSERLQNLK